MQSDRCNPIDTVCNRCSCHLYNVDIIFVKVQYQHSEISQLANIYKNIIFKTMNDNGERIKKLINH